MSRQEQRNERRQRILDAAEALVRETDGTAFTMTRLAKRARMSDPTPYNLFGGKGAILYSLLNRAMDQLVSSRGPLEETQPAALGPVRAMENAANFFIRDPELLRPLYKYQLGEYAKADRPAYMERALQFWLHSLSGLIAEGRFASDARFSATDIAISLLSQSIGLLDLWVQSELGDDEFRARMMLGAACIVYPAVPEDARKDLDGALGQLRRDIPPGYSFLS